MCNEKYHSWDISEPMIWLWEDLPYPRPDLLCDCGKRKLGIGLAKKYAIKGSLYGKKTPNNRMHLTAFGDESPAVIPLQSNLFADEPPATFGGK